MAPLQQNGIIYGIRRPDCPELAYPACSAPFFPSPSYKNTLWHELNSGAKYYLVYNKSEVRVYSDVCVICPSSFSFFDR